ncbi:NB-ARC domain-containing protein [Streptomyces sp. NPDC001985]|uniref:ATP-binding protein n=1 Tax=Streptomyces sp. NPDC001985 TaxID=3154406 RepID=UPI003321F95C
MLGNLPEESTSFVGRSRELSRLDRALGHDRLITLVGSGGVGKSRLALRAARRAAGAFSDGVAWADLAPLHGHRLLTATVSDACALNDHTPRMPVDALCEWLMDKRLLLVLDSCEHLLDPCRALVGDLLTVVPGLRVLVTSRQPLGMAGERLIEVAPLSVDEPDALELFRQRVAAAGAGPSGTKSGAGRGSRPGGGGSPTDGTNGGKGDDGGDEDDGGGGDGEAAVRICRRLEGIPLALELAAAQAGRTGLDEIAERLTSRFDVLRATDGAPAHPERHRTMLTTIGWSHELCAPLERLLWARLTVFRGDFEEEAARAVCAGGPLGAGAIGPLLDRLVAASVIRAVKVEGGSGVRYRMLDTIREYGRMWLRALHEESAVAERHADHFLRFAHRADERWLGPEQAYWYRRIGEVHTDLCTALDHLLTASPGRALRLMGLVGFFWSCCGHLHEARDYLEQALAAHPHGGPDRTRGLWALGVAVTLQGEYGTARRISEACAGSARRDGIPEGTLEAGYLGGLIALLTGRPLDADRIAAEALGAASAAPFDSGAGLRCHLVRVFALTGLGRLTEARERALTLRRGCVERGESWTRAYLDYQLSLIALFAGEPHDAAGHARAMLEGKRGIGDSFGIALGLDLLAAAIAAAGDGERAGQVYGTGQAFWSTVGHPQRGTPELAAVREQCERAARAGVGDSAYERAYLRGTNTPLETGLKEALVPPAG